MVDIYCVGGALLGVMIRYDVMLHIMKEDFIKANDFIELKFQDGTRGAIRKRQIIAFCESVGGDAIDCD